MKYLSMVLIVSAAVTATALAGGAGGADRPPAPGTPANPLIAQSSDTAVTGQAADGRFNEAATSRGAAPPSYADVVKGQPSQPETAFSPCNLLTQAEAQAIIGAPLRQPVEAPLGPTCIYRTADGKDMLTLAVQEATDFERIKRETRDPDKADVGGPEAFCGWRGQLTVSVKLKDKRVLTITGPCDISKNLAKAALKRLK